MRRIALLLLLLAAAAPAQAAAPGRSFAAPGELTALSLDGSRLAYGVEPVGAGCRSVWVWDLAKGTRTQVSGKATCAIPRTSTGGGLSEVALSGTTVAWTVQTGGNSEQAETLFVHTATARETQLAHSFRTGDADGALTGTWLGHLVASASGIFLDGWSTTVSGGTEHVGTAAINRIAGATLKPFYRGSEALFLRAAAPGRLATLDADGVARAFRGTKSTSVPAGGPAIRALTLDTARLVTLVRPASLQVRNADDLAAPARSFPAPAGAVTALAASGGVAVFAIGRTLYAESETTGKTAVLARGARAWRFVALDRSALAYAGSQVIHVMPFRTVAAAVS